MPEEKKPVHTPEEMDEAQKATGPLAEDIQTTDEDVVDGYN